MDDDEKIIKWIVGIIIVVALMFIFEIGPFERSIPAPQPVSNGWNGSFKGNLGCKKCSCPGWQGGSNPYSQCGRRLSNGKICTHNFYEHRSPGE